MWDAWYLNVNDTVHAFHFSIKQQNIIRFIFLVFKQKRFGRCKRAYLATVSFVSAPRCHNRGYVFNLILLIIADSNFQLHMYNLSWARIAKAKNIVDNPNTRKIQIRPVPVLGGLAIFFGIVVGILAAHTIVPCADMFVILACMMIMTYVGALDDVLDISPKIRLISEVAVILILAQQFPRALGHRSTT